MSAPARRVARVTKSLRLAPTLRSRRRDTGVLRARPVAAPADLDGLALRAAERRLREALRLEERGRAVARLRAELEALDDVLLRVDA